MGTIMTQRLLETTIKQQIHEFLGLRDQVVVIARLQVVTEGDSAPSVPDILTVLRAQEGVVVIKQLGPIRRVKRGKEHVDIEIKYLPRTKDANTFLDDLGNVLKVEGVKFVKLLTLGGHQTTKKDGKPWLF